MSSVISFTPVMSHAGNDMSQPRMSHEVTNNENQVTDPEFVWARYMFTVIHTHAVSLMSINS